MGENLLSAGFRKETGVIIVGVKKADEKMVFNPDSRSLIEVKDTLIVPSGSQGVRKLEKLVSRGPPLADVIGQS